MSIWIDVHEAKTTVGDFLKFILTAANPAAFFHFTGQLAKHLIPSYAARRLFHGDSLDSIIQGRIFD
ncbi:MAG: hypothetical protein EP320_10580 [Rhodobacteraceae bacterium]|nr:MAG: hypothetical protein EP320_10580 [Paracoccaceae bacterium]